MTYLIIIFPPIPKHATKMVLDPGSKACTSERGREPKIFSLSSLLFKLQQAAA